MTAFNILDLIIIAVIGLSALLSMYRGFFSEFFSLATWVVAIWLPLNYTEQFMILLPETIESDTARWFVSAILLFVGTMLVGGLLSLLVRKIIPSGGGMYLILGFGIGAVRGILVVALVALMASAFPPIPTEKIWNESKAMPQVLRVSRLIQNRMPVGIAKWFKTAAI